MRLLNVIMVLQIFNENWIYLRSHDQPKFSGACKEDRQCNYFQYESGLQCSLCAEDKRGKSQCLKTFIVKGWFIDQCKMSENCVLSCSHGGNCIQGGESYVQTCFCAVGYYGTLCTVVGKPGWVGLRMLQWHRQNAFAKPGEKTRFYYRAVGDTNVMEKGLYRVFKTGIGHTNNAGAIGKRGMTKQSSCMDKEGILCIEENVDLQFPYLLPNNDLGITVLKMGDKLRGYLTSVEAKFISEGMKQYVGYKFNVFVNYERVPVLKCIPEIKLTNCARSFTEVSNFSFRRNEYLAINHIVKYLEDGAYLSTAKENRQKCTAEDTTWTWTWSKYYIRYGLETQGEEGTEIGTYLKFSPFILDYGTYRVTLRIKRVVSAATNENFDECFFKLKPWPLEAVIDGGEVRKVIKGAGLTLTATRSYDPNQPTYKQDSLRVLWTCECLTKNIPNCENTCKINKKEPFRWMPGYQRFYLSPSQLQYNAEYEFKLTVDSTLRYAKEVAPQYSHVIVKVANESETVAVNYYIECIQNCLKERSHLPDEVLFLKAKVYGNGGLSQKVNRRIVFEWFYSKENDSVLYPVDSIKIYGPPSSMLGIKEGSFEQGVTYTIMLTERNSSEHLAEYSFTTNSVKYEGDCRVEPQSGVKGLSTFNIICDGFDGFIFEFYDKSDDDLAEKIVFNGRMLGTSEFSGSLEGVRITRGNIVVSIINKESGLYLTKVLTKVELSPWNISEAVMKEIRENLTSTVRLRDLSTTMNYVSFIPDILSEREDKSEMLVDLLKSIFEVRFYTTAEVKLSASTMKIVLQALNQLPDLKLDLNLVNTALAIIRRQASKLGKAVIFREISQWISSQEIRQVAVTILDCLNAAIRCQDASSLGLYEDLSFDNLFVLKEIAQETELVVDRIKDILSYIQAPGLPPVKLASSDESFQIWAMAEDIEYPVSKILRKDRNIPFGISRYFLKTYRKEMRFGTDIFFQAALIERNVFKWSQSDIRSKLVSLSVAARKKGQFMKNVKSLPSSVYVRIGLEKNLTNTTVEGIALQLDPHLDPEDRDMGVAIHRIDSPPKAFITICFLFPPTTESLRVLVMEDFRPDYELMTKNSLILNSSNPEYPLKHHSVDAQMFLYMGVLPGTKVPVNQTVTYEFQVTMTLCQVWIESQWSSIGCGVNMATSNETVCACSHLSIIAAAFPVPPESIDPFSDAKLFLTVLDNPVVVVFVIFLFIIYLLLVLWGWHKDNVDKYKGRVIVLDDNFPEDPYPYLVAVHTSSRFSAGTTAHVGIQLMGKEAKSRAHILSCEQHKVLKRNSDDWFLIYTPSPLGDVYEIQIWHDNYGSSPEWHCEKIIVYDITNSTESIFIMEQWLALREGDFPEAVLVIASDQDVLNIKRMFLDNAILGLRDSHTFLSIFIRHPRSEVTRVQRASILMCFIMVAMLCSIMFYKPTDATDPTDDYHYDVGTREIIVSVQTLLVTAALTMTVMFAFKRSYKVTQRRRRTTLHYRRDEFADIMPPQLPQSQGCMNI